MNNNFTRDMIFGSKKIENEIYNNTIENNIMDIELSKIINFRNGQPFKLYTNDKKEEMKRSILRNGVLVPILVRLIEDDNYEIISGHNRVQCCRELELKTIPTKIINCDDDTATLIMLETNLYQRDNLSIMEKAEAYKKQLEIIKKTAKENLDHYGPNSLSLSKEGMDSQTQIKRFIRLTNLIPSIQQKINSGVIQFLVGVELSYIDENEQETINNVIEKYKIKLTTKQAQYIRSIKGNIEKESLISYLNKNDDEKKSKFTGKINKEIIKKYKVKFTNDIEFNEIIDNLLIEYFKNKD